MQNALPSHVCLEFGHTAPSLGAFWLSQMLGHAAVGAARAQQVEPVFLLKPARMLRGDGQSLLERERNALVGVNELAGHVGLAVCVYLVPVRGSTTM